MLSSINLILFDLQRNVNEEKSFLTIHLIVFDHWNRLHPLYDWDLIRWRGSFFQIIPKWCGLFGAAIGLDWWMYWLPDCDDF